MSSMLSRIRQLLLYILLLLYVVPAAAQAKHPPISDQLKNFYTVLNDAGLSFTFPEGFKEIKAINNEDFSFDYAMEIPGADFEIWFQVKPQKANWDNYIKSKNDKDTKIANPDSLYLDMGQAQAKAFTGDNSYLVRTIPLSALIRYNADAGKTYLVNLPDLQATKHYKYAMVVVLQKNHTGTLLGVCLANELGPGFFKKLTMASSCLKFNP
jgi:outer membrane lipoprotein-sorting protein